MSKFLYVWLALLCAGAFSGCATLFNNGSQTVHVGTSDSKPAKVIVGDTGGQLLVIAPSSVPLKRSFGGANVKVVDSECVSGRSETTIERSISGWFFIDIISCSFYGATTDAVTGAMWNYDTSVVAIVNRKPDCVEKF